MAYKIHCHQTINNNIHTLQHDLHHIEIIDHANKNTNNVEIQSPKSIKQKVDLGQKGCNPLPRVYHEKNHQRNLKVKHPFKLQ